MCPPTGLKSTASIYVVKKYQPLICKTSCNRETWNILFSGSQDKDWGLGPHFKVSFCQSGVCRAWCLPMPAKQPHQWDCCYHKSETYLNCHPAIKYPSPDTAKEKQVVSSRVSSVCLINIDGVEQGVLQRCKRSLKMFRGWKLPALLWFWSSNNKWFNNCTVTMGMNSHWA